MPLAQVEAENFHNRIIERVNGICKFYDVTIDDVKSRQREIKFRRARLEIIKTLRSEFKLTHDEIGAVLNRDSVTVLGIMKRGLL